ncbi:hypothetical protein EV421DRAFT_1909858 [Armillaria borealis]|uniref:Uncharacterized protein n=1 Tax=Armillaria borealis TaxID=47425 RepID=A0AA39MH96_9AGAR|nr:hypothetical protein EV421DRAFT_1909858 [Armillaria borealis]
MSDGSYHSFPTPHSRYDANRQYLHYGHQYPGIPFENGIPHQNGLNSLGGLPLPFPRCDNGLPRSHTPTPAFHNHLLKFHPDPNLPAEFGVISGDNNTFYQRPPSPTAPVQSDDELPDASVIKGKCCQISKAQSKPKKVKHKEKSRDTPKPGSRNKVKGTAIKAEPISKKGRAPGARGYSDKKSTVLLLLALEVRPLGESTAPAPRRDPIGLVKDTKAPKNSTVLTKAYRVENPVAAAKSHTAGGRHPSATEALGAITSFFDPAVMKNHDDKRVSQALQLSQMETLQAEIQEL